MAKLRMGEIKVTFGMIVLNGEPFVVANLRALYRFAHQIIIVEGASPHAAESATPDGHSLDGTLESIRSFIANEDKLGKVSLVTAEDEGHPNGFWPHEKTQQSQAYAKRATGDYLWQIDVDEFYSPQEMAKIISYLAEHPKVNGVLFGAYHFYCGARYVVEGGFIWHPQYQGECFGRYRRLFKWSPGWSYAAHRPPTIVDANGGEVTAVGLVDCRAILGKSRAIYHYFMHTPEVILRKATYYSRISPEVFANRRAASLALLQNVDSRSCLRIFNQFSTWNWLVEFEGEHPPEMEKLLRSGFMENRDINVKFAEIAARPGYRLSVFLLTGLERVRSVWVSSVFWLKRSIIRKAPRFPKIAWKIIPRPLHKYRNPYWQIEPWAAEALQPRQPGNAPNAA